MRVGSWPWLCPQRILMTHPVDQWAQLRVCGVAATLPVKFLSRLSRLCVRGQGVMKNLTRSLVCWGGLVCIRPAGQAHRKDRTLAQFARHGHVATHHARELAGDGKAEPGAAEAPRGRGIGLAELLEQLGLLLRRHANAG